MSRHLVGWLGRMLNALGVPGAIRPSLCQERLDIPIEVRVGPLFTVIAVKDIQLFFHRLSGRFDGVVVNQLDCKESEIESPALANERSPAKS